MKKIISLLALFALTFMISPVSAKSGPKAFSLPASAVEVASGVFSLGQAYDAQSNSMVDGYALVHKKSDAKSGGNASVKSGPTCYGYLATGAKWKNLEPWQFNPTNTFGLDPNQLFTTESADIQKWETAAQFNILANGALTGAALTASTTATDGLNAVYFGPLADNSTIAVTIVWGIFSGPTFNRKLVEWDQVFNTNYPWSLSGEVGKMDFENISTHELGHAVGMADIYTSSCSAVTMYGYANFGDTNKRTLEAPDITGINGLY